MVKKKGGVEEKRNTIKRGGDGGQEGHKNKEAVSKRQ